MLVSLLKGFSELTFYKKILYTGSTPHPGFQLQIYKGVAGIPY